MTKFVSSYNECVWFKFPYKVLKVFNKSLLYLFYLKSGSFFYKSMPTIKFIEELKIDSIP